MLRNNNFACHVKEKCYLVWYHPTTSQCRLT